MAAGAKGRRTEAAFHAAAREVFARDGYLNAKIADIADVAGRSAASFYNYYDNKQRLLEALLDRFTDDVLSRTGEQVTRDLEQDIEAAVRVYFETYREYVPEMIGAFQLSMTDPQFAAWWSKRRMEGIKGVLAVVRSVERKGIDVGLDRNVFASAIVSMMESFCWTWYASAGELQLKRPDDDEAIRTVSEIFRRALYPG
ncbi:putative TetR family transcriptional regulator [Gordonia effusa NBRC 100432]|uniref:Putative TetR family transcriptional regulator n=1 Tax=Gordonia effusa NBRC 100432 TaxID=1077974 RepID=H0R4M2_9ACTN|nr:TetR/AcrR family transcriptional regulator [Gordonia effusa]GAB20023.1 putative TetR family transcriptional regulator [Gordonia effusa NBRC 100432]